MVGLDVFLLDLYPLGTETQLRGLELQVGVLSTGHFVVKDTRVGSSDIRFKGSVEDSNLGPVLVEGLDVFVRDTCAEASLFQGRDDSTHGRLRGQTGKVVNGHVDDIGTGLSGGQHGCGSDTRSVVRVNMDGKVWVGFSDGADEQACGLGLEETSHVFDTENVDSLVDQLLSQVEVVVEGVFGLFGVGNIARVADGSLDNTSGFLGRVDTELQIVNIVERVEDSEDVQTSLDGFFGEFVNGIVGVGGVSDSVGSSNKGLEGDIGDEFSQGSQSFPGVFIKEPHRYVESGSTPAFERVGVLKRMGSLLGDIGHIDCSHSGSEERLVGISPSGVHDKGALVVSNSLGESLGTLVDDDVPPALLAWNGSVDTFGGVCVVGDDGDERFGSETGFAGLTLDRGSVDSEVAQVPEQLLSSVLGPDELE